MRYFTFKYLGWGILTVVVSVAVPLLNLGIGWSFFLGFAQAWIWLGWGAPTVAPLFGIAVPDDDWL